jgi:hypothetical protein
MRLFKLQYFAVSLIIAGVILAFWYLYFGGYFIGSFNRPDATKVKEISPFTTGLVVPLLTIGSTLLIYLNLRNTARQNFSSNFFKLMEMHHKLRDNISDEVWEISDEPASKGKDFFDDLCARICFDFYNLPDIKWKLKPDDKRMPNANTKAGELIGKQKLTILYNYYFHIHQSSLGHYFRNLYYLVKYADDSYFPSKFKTEHIRMLRAQLSNYELLLLAYNCLHPYGENFYPLVEKYELLKSLNNEDNLSDEYEKRIVDINILTESYAHLKKYSEIATINKYTGNITYGFKNKKIFGKTVSLFWHKRTC